MTPEEKRKLERILSQAAAEASPPESLRDRIFAADGAGPERSRTSRKRLVFPWPGLAAAVAVFGTIVAVILSSGPFPSGVRPASPQEPDPRELVRRLGADEIAAREAAAAELARMGEKARAALEEGAKAGEPEVRSRVQALLGELDRRVNMKKIETGSGVLGDTGVAWVAREMFDLAGIAENLPGGLRPVLADARTLHAVLVSSENGQVRSSEVKLVMLSAGSNNGLSTVNAGPFLLCRRRFVLDRPAGGGGHRFGEWWKDVQKPQATELLRLWPQLRRASLVFVAPGGDAATLRNGLEQAVSHGRADVRAAAVHALGQWYHASSVDFAVKALDDGDPAVREAGADILRSLVSSDGLPADVSKWWRSLDPKTRNDVMKNPPKSWTQGGPRPCACEGSNTGR